MSKWSKAEGKIISCRVSEGVYTLLEAKARGKGLRLGAYISQVLTGGANKINGVKSTEPRVYTPMVDAISPGVDRSGYGKVSIPIYNPQLHKMVVSNIDADGNTF